LPVRTRVIEKVHAVTRRRDSRHVRFKEHPLRRVSARGPLARAAQGGARSCSSYRVARHACLRGRS
jgi:hypothetical protein